VNASDNSGGSGVREVRFNAKWNNEWQGIGVDTTYPYSMDWNMCTSGVPNGDVELGMEIWDNNGNKFVWSSDSGYPNPHITKSYNCSPPPVSEGIWIYRNTGYGGDSCFIVDDAPSIGNHCGDGWNDDPESVLVQGSYYFAFFRDDNYSGGAPLSGNFSGDFPDEWKNQISSVRVRRASPAKFTLYRLGDWNGENFSSDRDIYNLAHWSFNDKTESIRVMPGYQVVLCEHDNFHGVCGRTDHDVSDLNAVAQGLRGELTSVRVCQGSCPSVPSDPTLVTPRNDQIIQPGDPISLQWNGNGIQYFVEYWGGDLNAPVKYGWFNGKFWNIGALPESDNPYYWRVKAWNNYGESGWSPARQFYVKWPTLAGDADDDGDVDIFDYNVVIQEFGTFGEPGWVSSDFDIDGDVDIFDFNLMLQHFGNTRISGIVAQNSVTKVEYIPNAPSNVNFTFENNSTDTYTFVGLEWEDNSDNEEGFIFSWNAELLSGSNIGVPPYPSGDGFRQDTTSAKLINLPCDNENTKYFAGTIQSYNSSGASEPVVVIGSTPDTNCRIQDLVFSSNAPVSLNNPVYLSASIEMGSDVVYEWNFGDGTYGTGPEVTHTYSVVGDYTATVTATNSINVLTDTNNIRVIDQDPIAGLWIRHDGPTLLGTSTTLTPNVESGDDISYTWNLGDGTIINGENITHEYSEVGVYQVTVTATNLVSTQDSTAFVYVDEEISNLSINTVDSTDNGDLSDFQASLVTGSNVFYRWDFGDGSIDVGPAVYHVYNSPGTYTVTLRASNSVNAVVASKTIVVNSYIYLPNIMR
jgi:PKD repeat protein